MLLENGTMLGNRYEILGKIGSGGTADVYKAKCHKLNRFVAIKVLKSEFSEDRTYITKFRSEAQSAAGMTHANIVNVYDVGDENGIYYIVMELVEGITLKQYIDKKGALDYREAVSVAIQIVQGIEAAHKHNIIHRDIKPQNIIISKEGKVKVTDFGIAKMTNADTMNSMAMGSVHYISPEQARGGYSAVTSDIYSFGITLYEMCTGRVPFDGDNAVAVALMHIKNDLVPPTTYNPSIPVSVEAIIMKCAMKRTDKRYQSATELITDLKRALITPYENFVVIPNEVDISPTMTFAPDELEQIKAETVRESTRDFAPTQTYDDVEDEEYHYVYDDDEDGEDDEEEYVTSDDNKIDKIMVWFGVGIAVLIVVITIIVVLRVANTFGSGDNTNKIIEPTTATPTVAVNEGVEVPALIGYTEDEAKKVLNELNLGYKRATDTSEIVASGLVMAQSVDEGVHVAEHTTIVVTISTGSASFDLTDVVNYTEENALNVLENELKLNVNVEYEYNKDVQQGIVIKTIPVAGSQVKVGDTINVTVSRGSEVVEGVVPNIVNMDESEAREAIDNAGLVAQLGGTASSSTVEKGKVIAQNYPAGTKLSAGAIVEYVLSAGINDKKYSGKVTIYKAWAYSRVPEGYNADNGTIEIQAILRQSKDGEDQNSEILSFTNVNNIEDTYEIAFAGLISGVPDANVEVIAKYSWTDADGNATTSDPVSIQTIGVTMSEVSN